MTRSPFRREPDGTLYLRPGAIPLVIAAIVLPIVAAILIGVLTVGGMGPGLAVGAAAVAVLVVLAFRARPGGRVEVAPRAGGDTRLLVVATAELTPGAAGRVAELAGEAADVRLLVPVGSRRLDRWLSAEDDARGAAERALAHGAGALVAAGLPVSGSVGDSDPAQAVEDELRSYPADLVVLVAERDSPGALDALGGRLELPLERVEVDPGEAAPPARGPS